MDAWQKTNVEVFTGLNSGVSPELIKDGEARDILNFHMEKVGKLVTRDGSACVLYTLPAISARSAGPTAVGEVRADPVMCYSNNKGIIGIGEITLAEKWTAMDTDRFMVYVVRGADNGSYKNDPATRLGVGLSETARDIECYLFSPITGRYKNVLMTNYSWTPAGTVPPPINITSKRGVLPQGTDDMSVQLYAPNREIPELYDSSHTTRYNASDDDHWIKQFVDMHQYRHQLIISDRINGDMLIEDEATREKIEQCDDPDHELMLRPNTLDIFDIDSVFLDGRFQEHEENDATTDSEGVTNGMALYNYELPEEEIMVTQDYAKHYLDDYEWVCDGDADDDDMAYDKVQRYITQPQMSDFLTIINQFYPGRDIFDDDKLYGVYLYHNENKKYLFSNENTPGSFFDILGEVKLPDDEYIDEDGKKVTEFSSNAYIWEDHQLPYYPSRGFELTNIMPQSDYLLREIDNIFQKFTKDVPRITKLEPIENAGKYAPLGVWRYRFVWDYGGGVYSAPSAEMLCPDIMWSALKDDEVYVDGETNYARPQKLNGYELEDDYSFINDIIGYQWAFSIRQSRIYKVPPLFLYGVGTTKFGELMFNIKTELYSLQHRYGPQFATLAELQTYPTDVEGLHTIGKLGCMATVFFSSSSLKLNGTIWEGVGISQSGNGWSHDVYLNNWHLKYSKKVVCNAGGLVVPIFQGIERYTYDSVFDDEGRLRLAYQMLQDGTGLAKSKNYLVAPGANIGFGIYNPDDEDPDIFTEILFANQGESPQTVSDLYYNLITIPLDQHNDPNIELLCMRADTIVRGVKQEKDRLTDVKSDIDPEALARLVLQGTCELHLCKNGEDVYVQSADDGDVYTGASDRDEHVNRSWSTGTEYGDLYSLYFDTLTTTWEKEPLNRITNLDIYIYGTGERLTAAEQLTAYFPSALLFGAPRMGLKIQNNDVPKRAKRLLIFRTKSTHSNDYHPLNYGLVDIVEIQRSDGTVIDPDTTLTIPDGDAYTEVEDTTGTVQNVYRGIYYFDKIKDTKLDFGDKPENYDGLTKALKSRFNIPLNERVYYLNFEEEYQLLRPRLSEYNYNDIILLRANTIDNTDVHVYPSTDETGYDVYVKVKYKYIYIDVNDVRSEINISLFEEIEVDGSVAEPKVVILTFIPSQYDGTIDRVEIYRSKEIDGVWSSYYKIGEMEEGTQGIFVDNDLKNLNELGCTLPQIYNYESGMRWSEPYRPDWIKAENFTEYRSGDGDQITGVQSNYGNLVVFKETSVHREAVQAEEIPLSRRDEVTPDTGAIAPNAIISINNTIYFLSWEGLKTFDNNQVVNIDQPFNEELMLVLERAKHAGETIIRDASCGYNPYYNELYTNVPALPSLLVDDQRMREYGQHLQHYHYRTLLGHIYVICLDGYATKYGNTATLLDENYSENGQLLIHETTDTRQNLRKYYTNSMGEMRSADVFPQIWASLYDINTLNKDGFLWGGVYIETPYDLLGDGRLLRDYDLLLNARWYDENMDRTQGTLADVIDDAVIGYQYRTNIFPMTLPVPILARYKSKFYTGDEETLIKRIRKCNINIYSRGAITIKAIVIPYQDYDERIDNVSLPLADQTFVFNPSQSNTQPFNNNTLVGTKHGILSIVPRTPYGPPLPDDLFIENVFNDRYAKPVRVSIEVEASYRTQLNAIALHWRGIQKYLM